MTGLLQTEWMNAAALFHVKKRKGRMVIYVIDN